MRTAHRPIEAAQLNYGTEMLRLATKAINVIYALAIR
jgi:hypothetical protein